MRIQALALLTAVITVATAAPFPENLISSASLSVSSAASPAGGKYGAEKMRDGAGGSWWASKDKQPMPQWVRLEWKTPVAFDTLSIDIIATKMGNIYASWKRLELYLDGKLELSYTPQIDEEKLLLRLPRKRSAKQLELRICEVVAPRHYVGICEFGIFLDPQKRIAPRTAVATRLPQDKIKASPRREHPCVYLTPKDVERGQRNATTTDWGKATKEKILADAEKWLAKNEEEWLAYLPDPGACYAYGFVGCPICGTRFGTWGGARCSWDKPGIVRCGKGHEMPNGEFPDNGSGYQAKDGRFHYFLGVWNAWVTEQWTRQALPTLCHAYALTGEERFAERAAFFFDILSAIYPESSSGSWDYPSRPPSGRFARPWYQVSRNLVVYVAAYDLIYNSKTLDKPSRRPQIAAQFTAKQTLQNKHVGTPDSPGTTRAGMSRRENIDQNLMRNAAAYCYDHSFSGKLHNGHADYMRGALAVGALLGIEPYVENAVTGPYSIYSMLTNNVDRDGRYYETALGYAHHTRNLYLTFVAPLKNWQSPTRPNGVDLFADSRMRSFYQLPDLAINCSGHAPNFGDAGPDNRFALPSSRPFSGTDYNYAERLFAQTSGESREQAAKILNSLAGGEVEKARRGFSDKKWLLYHAEPVPATKVDPDIGSRFNASTFFGQKGIAILRDGKEENSQSALLRFGPSLNHGDKDDLGLIYYAKGWQMFYEIGYGLGSTHTHVGWASQTAAHALVTVNESSQSGGSGGSLLRFADLPGCKVMEADSPLSYAKQDVSIYRRLVALVGSGSDQVLVDLFRVRGGTRHDYGFGVQTREVRAHGLEFGAEQEGSLARDVAWGENIGLDGDIKGYPNKPYWNPPPQNGYGFFFDPRHAAAKSPFSLDFSLGGSLDSHLRVHPLPEAGTEAVLAKAPGLYPHNAPATYLMLRRQAETAPLASTFAAVYEPYARQVDMREGLDCEQLQRHLTDYSAVVKPLNNLNALFLRGSKAGDYMEFEISVETDADYDIAVRFIRAPSYGTVRLLLDGHPFAKTFNAVNPNIDGPKQVDFGTRHLVKGDHRLRLELMPGPQFFISITNLLITPKKQPTTTPPAQSAQPILQSVSRLTVENGVGIDILRRNGEQDIILSGDDLGNHRTATIFGNVSWRGSFVHLHGRNNQLDYVETLDADNLRLGKQALGNDPGRLTAKVESVDLKRNEIHLDTELPTSVVGLAIHFTNPRYSRSTTYKIHGVRTTATGNSILELGSQSPILGRGRVHQIVGKNSLLSNIPHDYAVSVVGGANTGFFNGKRLVGHNGGATTIREIRFGTPMTLTVDDSSPFHDGEILEYHDIQSGDQAIIPLPRTFHLTQQNTKEH